MWGHTGDGEPSSPATMLMRVNPSGRDTLVLAMGWLHK